MERIIGGNNLEDFGITIETYRNNIDIHEDYEVFYTKYDIVKKLLLKMSKSFVRLQKLGKNEEADAELKTYKKLFDVANCQNPFYEIKTIEVENGFGYYNNRKIEVVNLFDRCVKNGKYEVIFPPILIDEDRWLFTPCIVSNVRNK